MKYKGAREGRTTGPRSFKAMRGPASLKVRNGVFDLTAVLPLRMTSLREASSYSSFSKDYISSKGNLPIFWYIFNMIMAPITKPILLLLGY